MGLYDSEDPNVLKIAGRIIYNTLARSCVHVSSLRAMPPNAPAQAPRAHVPAASIAHLPPAVACSGLLDGIAPFIR